MILDRQYQNIYSLFFLKGTQSTNTQRNIAKYSTCQIELNMLATSTTSKIMIFKKRGHTIY